MSKFHSALLPVVLFTLLGATPSFAQSGAAAPPANDWPTYGYDQERTGWNRGETALDKTNVSKLKVQWSTQLSTPPTAVALATLSPPVIAAGVPPAAGPKNLLYLLGADDTLFALDTDTGKVLWQKTYPNPVQPGRPGTWLCSNTANGAPAIDKANGVIYFLASDGKLRGAALGDGSERLAPTDMVAPFARAWGLNIIDNVVYTTNARGCGELVDPNSPMMAAETLNPGAQPAPTPPGRRPMVGPPIDPGMVTAVDVHDPAHPQVTHFYTSNGRPAGPWGRGGVTRGPSNTLLIETADGFVDPAAGQYGISILMLAPKATRLMDMFTPKNWRYMNSKDLDWSASPIVFPFAGKTLVAVAGKEAVIDLLDTSDLGGGPSENHSTPLYQGPQLGNDAAAGTQPSQGIWGGIATYQSPAGRRFIYTPMWGPQSTKVAPFKFTSGPVPNGSIMAVEVVADGDKLTEIPTWTSPDMIMPDPPTVANGVVFATQTGGQALQNTPMPDGTPRDATTTGAVYRATPVSNLVLYAFDAETGKQLYSSGKTITDWVHFNEPVVALGKVFIVTHDAHVYAFGVKR
ncbi:MAG TPA: PQQ-binding-like beta-propeller repeat protein [Steroidobacteraceae bacterium]|nr:PQQ-binding-like beta-propeller repeat protein [Steroidobacteraceae bacterium]